MSGRVSCSARSCMAGIQRQQQASTGWTALHDTDWKVCISKTWLYSEPYSVMDWSDRPSAFVSAIADMIADVCDFSRQLQR